jgi:predicted nucleic acid-binding protein
MCWGSLSLRSLTILVVPASAPSAVAKDADDDHVNAAAAADSAEIVASGDRHLLALGSHQGIGIVNAAEAVRRVEDARSKT